MTEDFDKMKILKEETKDRIFSKTFFRRTIVSEQTFICQYNGNCDVNKSEKLKSYFKKTIVSWIIFWYLDPKSSYKKRSFYLISFKKSNENVNNFRYPMRVPPLSVQQMFARGHGRKRCGTFRKSIRWTLTTTYKCNSLCTCSMLRPLYSFFRGFENKQTFYPHCTFMTSWILLA